MSGARGRDVRPHPGAPTDARREQIRYRMRQGAYNELRSVELIVLPRRRLIDLGEDPDAYRPLPEWEALFDWLIACRTRPTLEKLAMFQFAGETQSCEGLETLIELARDLRRRRLRGSWPEKRHAGRRLKANRPATGRS